MLRAKAIWRIGDPIPDDWVAVPNSWLAVRNPRRGRVDKIVESIETSGFYQVLVVQAASEKQGGPRLLVGNHRVKAGKKLGMTHFPVRVFDCDDVLGDRILIADNRTAETADWDKLELCEMLQEFESLEGTGFTPFDLESMLSEIEAPPAAPDFAPSDVPIRFGELSWTIPREQYEAWIGELADEVGPDPHVQIAEVSARLSL